MNLKFLDVPQGSDAWFAARAGRVTGSLMGAMMAGLTSQKYANLVAELAMQRNGAELRTFKAKATDHGIEHEAEALARFMFLNPQYDLETDGFFYSEDVMIGMSPDAYIYGEVMVEVKCPIQPAVHLKRLRSGFDKDVRDQGIWNASLINAPVVHLISYSPDFPPKAQMYVETVTLAKETKRRRELKKRWIATERNIRDSLELVGLDPRLEPEIPDVSEWEDVPSTTAGDVYFGPEDDGVDPSV